MRDAALAADDSAEFSVSIDQILSAVQSALTETQVSLYNNKMPPLKNVTVELQAIFSTSAEEGFNLYVISENGKLSLENTQKDNFVARAPES
jgi:multidrug efflux pump subunit AcrB